MRESGVADAIARVRRGSGRNTRGARYRTLKLARSRNPECIDGSPCRTANLPQVRLKPILKAHADPRGVRVNRGLMAFEQDDTGCAARSWTRRPAKSRGVSQYVIAADGGRTPTWSASNSKATTTLSAPPPCVWLANPETGGTMTGGVLTPMGPQRWGSRSQAIALPARKYPVRP